MAEEPVRISEEQALYFRALRSHLAGSGAPDPAAAARDILGAQSQQLGPSLWALSLRTEGRPTALELKRRILEHPRRLVRTWGQRDTLHVYEPVAHWADIVAARPQWAPGGRRGDMPAAPLVEAAGRVLESVGKPITRSHIFELLPADYVADWEARVGPGEVALRYAAGRVLWRLAHQGRACAAGKAGSEQEYAARKDWFPELVWPRPMPSAREAAKRLARAYLRLHGPATAHDMAHFFGAGVGSARGWIKALAAETPLARVECGDRRDLFLVGEDVPDLTTSPPSGDKAWPPRLLPQWDTLMMGHADKSWVCPAASERKSIWRASAFVAATVVARGRVVATWSQTKKGRQLRIVVRPLSLWRASEHAGGVEREAGVLAAHLGLDGAELTVSKS